MMFRRRVGWYRNGRGVAALACVLWFSAATSARVSEQKPGSRNTSPAAPKGAPAKNGSPATPVSSGAKNGSPAIPTGVATTPDYVIGPDDVLSVIFWRDKDLSSDVTVRPDGKISLPLLNEVRAAGLTPEQLRVQLTEAAGKFIEEPTVSIVVKAINSRKVFLTGQVNKQGPYPLSGPTTVVQLLAMAGGLLEYANSENIRILRVENGRPMSYRFNYKEILNGKNLKQNIELKPGDTVVVP